MRDNQGFTLLELMIVVALIAIIATLATPSMRNFIQRSHVNQQTQELTAHLQEVRGRAVLLRGAYETAISQGVGDVAATYDDTTRTATWSYNGERVNITPATATLSFSLMGQTQAETCFIITHTSNSAIGQVVILDQNGSTKIHKNKIDCIF